MRKPVLAILFLACAASVPAHADGYSDFNRGVVDSLRGEHQAAIDLFTSALASTDLPAHLRPTAYLARGEEYQELEKYESAVADFTVAIGLAPGDAQAYLERCEARADGRQFADALADCSHAVDMQPQNGLLRQFRAGVYVRMKDFDRALAEYSSLLTTRPDDGELLLGRAEVYRLSGQYDRAIQDAQAAREALPSRSPLAYSMLANIYFLQGDLKNALDSQESAVNRAYRDSQVYYVQGEIQWAAGRFGDAEDSFAKSLELEPLQPYAFLWLSISAKRQGHKVPDDVTAAFSTASVSRSAAPLVQLYLGRSGPEQALQVLAKDQGEDGQCAANLFVGEWYLIQGDAAHGKGLLQQALTVCAPDREAHRLIAIDLARLP
ncbi:MAG TPA: tetratricopeptide repeat protein [Rhizomicrobium sp.]